MTLNRQQKKNEPMDIDSDNTVINEKNDIQQIKTNECSDSNYSKEDEHDESQENKYTNDVNLTYRHDLCINRLFELIKELIILK